MKRAILATVLATVVLSAACASSGGRERTDPNLLTQAQIEAVEGRSVLEVVERLRPRWLNQRFERSMRLETQILVYQNGSLLGGVDVLRDIPAQGIYSIRYLDANQAGRLPGAGSTAVAGAIVLATSPEHEIR